jgi:hypothetical protein
VVSEADHSKSRSPQLVAPVHVARYLIVPFLYRSSEPRPDYRARSPRPRARRPRAEAVSARRWHISGPPSSHGPGLALVPPSPAAAPPERLQQRTRPGRWPFLHQRTGTLLANTATWTRKRPARAPPRSPVPAPRPRPTAARRPVRRPMVPPQDRSLSPARRPARPSGRPRRTRSRSTPSTSKTRPAPARPGHRPARPRSFIRHRCRARCRPDRTSTRTRTRNSRSGPTTR